ncbi:GIY-YIG nuclease family protein [Pseudomonas paraeruginosa]|uniref:GIY-YIG nuclease family protein n=1 Tax=Pseudomonas aeruginosa TaxID=287 RepID=UPI0021E3DE15|nr:GIY-YIG nuclease family protein [Pseudomonas aeruginosa]MCV2495834.1 GIY-YIG nuclease family protein [Pseudomonas aeruginosa]
MNYGFIYCLSNPSMPGIYKVGKTDRAPSQRCFELSNSTSVPEPFFILFYIEVDNALQTERALHRDLDDFRVSPNREFFNCDPVAIYNWLLSNCDIETEWLDGEMQYELVKERNAKTATAVPQIALADTGEDW